MSRSHLYFALAFVLTYLFTFSHSLRYGPLPCSLGSWQTESQSIEFENGIFVVNGLGGYLFPREPKTSRIITNRNMSWNIVEFQHLKIGPDQEFCLAGDDENVNHGPNPVAELIKFINFGNISTCYVQKLNEKLSDDVNITVIMVEAYWPEYPDFHFVFNASLASAPFTITVPGVPSNGFLESRIDYDPKKVKIGFELTNWPWEGYGDTSYLSFYYHVHTSWDRPYHIHYNWNLTDTFVKAHDDEVTLIQYVDSVAFVSYKNSTTGELYYIAGKLPSPTNSTFPDTLVTSSVNIVMASPSCVSIENRFRDFVGVKYDPTFQVLFGNSLDDKKVNKARTGLIIGVVVAVIVIIILTSLVVVIQVKFRPFSRRVTTLADPNVKPSSSSWTRASKPT